MMPRALLLFACAASSAAAHSADLDELLRALTATESGGALPAAVLKCARTATVSGGVAAPAPRRGAAAAAFVAEAARAGGPPTLDLIACALSAAPRARLVTLAPPLWPIAVSFFGASLPDQFAVVDALLRAPEWLLVPPPPPPGDSALHSIFRADWALLGDVTSNVLNPRRQPGAGYAEFLAAFAGALADDAVLAAEAEAGGGAAAALREAGARLSAAAVMSAGARAVRAADVAALAAAMSAQLFRRVAAAAAAAAPPLPLDALLVARDAFGRTPVHLAAALAAPPGRLQPAAAAAHAGWLRALAAAARARNASGSGWCGGGGGGGWPAAPLALRDVWGLTAADVEAQQARGASGGGGSGGSAMLVVQGEEEALLARLDALQRAACLLDASAPGDPAAGALAACLGKGSTAAAAEAVLTSLDAAQRLLARAAKGKVARWPAETERIAACAAALQAPTPLPTPSVTPFAASAAAEELPATASSGGWVEPAWLPPASERALAAAAALRAAARSGAAAAPVAPCAVRVFDVQRGGGSSGARVSADGAVSSAADDGALDEAALTDAFVAALTANEPLLLRGLAGAAWPALAARWSLAALLEAHGARPAPIGAIPYAGVFGFPQHKASLADYALGMLFCRAGGGGAAQLPRELLDGAAAAAPRLHARLLRLQRGSGDGGGADEAWRTVCSAAGVPLQQPPPGDAEQQPALYIFNRAMDGLREEDTPLPPFLVNVSLRAWRGDGAAQAGAAAWFRSGGRGSAGEEGGQPLLSSYPERPNVQFYLGPPGTGAPMHYHLDAVNVLLHGEKDWLLLPPAAAVYSTERAAGLFQSLAAGRAAAAGPPPMLCTQRAGDAMFVPRGWGHAILNTRTSVGYAVEFATPLQIY